MARHANNGGDPRSSAATAPRTDPMRATALIARWSARLGTALYRLRRLIWGLMAIAASAFVVSLVATAPGNAYSLLLLIALIWLSFLVAYGHLMARGIPEHPTTSGGVLAVIAWRLRQLLGWALLIIMAALACVLAFFTLRALSAIGP